MSNATRPIDATLSALASAMRLQYAAEPAAIRAVERAVEILVENLPYQFDGVELRVLSFSQRRSGLWHTTDGERCDCLSSRRQYCRHRALFRLLLAQWAMTQPGMLRARLLESLAPVLVDDGYDELGNFLDQPSIREVTPAAGTRWASAQDAADSLFS